MAKNRKTPDMNLPVWFDGQNINEALFCEEFLHERRIIFTNGAFFTPDGRVTDDLPLRGEIYDKLKFCAVNNIPRKITNILEVLKLEAQVPDFPPEQDRIHVFNGTLLLNGTFTEGRPAIVRSRLPVVYNPDAPAPVIWLNFLNGLLHAEDIHTLQEFIGYCLPVLPWKRSRVASSAFYILPAHTPDGRSAHLHVLHQWHRSLHLLWNLS